MSAVMVQSTYTPALAELGEPGSGAARHEAAGGHDLDRIDPHLVVVAHLVADLIEGVDLRAGVVGVPGGGGDLRPGGDHPRPAHIPVVYGLAHGHVDVVPRPQALSTGDADAEQFAGGARGVEGEAGDLMGAVVGVFDGGTGGEQMVVGLDETGHKRGAGQVEAPDVGNGQVGPGGQVRLRLGDGAHEQDALVVQQHGAAASGAPGGLGRARALAVGPDVGNIADDLESAGRVATAPRDEAVGGQQNGRAAVEALTAISGRSGPPGDLTGGREGIVGHEARIAGFRGSGASASQDGTPRVRARPAQPRGMMKELPSAKGKPGLSTASTTGWASSMRPSVSKLCSPSGPEEARRRE